METPTAQRWNVVEHPTWEAAVQAASQEAAATMAATTSVILYQQAKRQFLVTSFPLSLITERVKMDNLKAGEDPDAHYNRPLIPEHVRAIEEYLVSHDEYILPPLTLCVQDRLSVHVIASPSQVKIGTIVLPYTTKFTVTDGQHRIKGIQQAFTRTHKLDQDAIGVTIVNETEITKVHQDFVDCAQTKAISKALLTAFNVRDPLARLVREIANEFVFFRNRIEKVGQTVGKNSVNLFTMNQLRLGVAELLIGGVGSTQEQQRKDVADRIPDDQMHDLHKKRLIDFYKKFAMDNPQWLDVVLAAERPAEDLIDTRALRERYIHFNGTGLIVIGRVGHYILQQPEEPQNALITRLAQIDWSRDGELWAGNLISSDGRLANQYALVNAAVLNVKREIGLEPTPAELRSEALRERRVLEKRQENGNSLNPTATANSLADH